MRGLIQAALKVLGIDDLVLIAHDASFPGGGPGDLGRGSPYTPTGRAFLSFAEELGFTAVQLGPQGMTSRDDLSPYDGTVFSRSILAIDFAALGLDVEPARTYAEAHDRAHALLADLHARHGASAELAEFQGASEAWLLGDALYAALFEANGRRDFVHWPTEQRHLWRDRAHVDVLVRRHARELERYALGQLVAHRQHAELRAQVGLSLFGDLQVGYSRQDRWRHASVFLRDYVMGAPPSRTNPEGQPWDFPVLDPSHYGTLAAPGPAMRLLTARIDKALAEYDRLRVDHPHGLVCPWVYRGGQPDPLLAVRQGARLFASPDLPEHPDLARFAIPAELDRSLPRHHDHAVRSVDAAAVARYAILVDAVVARAGARGANAFVCEVLSTQPNELAAVMQRYGMGRFRITQKADVRDARDVYRGENAAPADWVMLGNHDTPTIWSVARRWEDAAAGEAEAAYLSERLGVAVGRDPLGLVHAKAAELFVGPARHVMIFWGDLLGETRRYNEPGTVGDHNWSLRIGADYRQDYARKLETGRALSLPSVLAQALETRAADAQLIAALRSAAHTTK
jgi:4-alpha-glucanotransferase